MNEIPTTTETPNDGVEIQKHGKLTVYICKSIDKNMLRELAESIIQNAEPSIILDVRGMDATDVASIPTYLQKNLIESWEALPEKFPDVSMTRAAFHGRNKKNDDAGPDSLLRILTHDFPGYASGSMFLLKRDLAEKIREESFQRPTISVLNSPLGMNRPVDEAGILEAFYTTYLGSLVESFEYINSTEYSSLKELLEAIEEKRNRKVNEQIYITPLRTYFSTDEALLQRLQEFEREWLMGEIKRARGAKIALRKWIDGLLADVSGNTAQVDMHNSHAILRKIVET